MFVMSVKGTVPEISHRTLGVEFRQYLHQVVFTTNVLCFLQHLLIRILRGLPALPGRPECNRQTVKEVVAGMVRQSARPGRRKGLHEMFVKDHDAHSTVLHNPVTYRQKARRAFT